MEEITKVEELNIQGYNLMYAGNPKEAIEYFVSAEKEDPNYVVTYINMGLCYAGLGDYSEAKAAFQKALKLDKKNVEALEHLADICYLLRDFSEGIEYANTAIEYGSNSPKLYYNLGLAWEELNEDLSALRNYNKAIELDPQEAIYHIRKAHCLVNSRKFDEALTALEVLNHYCPDSFESYHYSFLIYMQKGDYEKANAVIDSGLELFPGDVSLYYDKIRILSAVRQFDDALSLITALKELKDFDTEKRNIVVEEAKIYMQTNRFPEAIKTLEEAVDLPGGNDFEAHYYLMNAYLANQNFDKVEKIAKIMLEADDGSAFVRSAMYYYPMSITKQGKDALSAYKQSIQKLRLISLKQPNELDALLFRALCHKDIKEYDKAIEVLDYALKMKSDYAPAHAIKANVLKDKGDMVGYKDELAQAKSQDSNLSDVLTELGVEGS